MRKYRSPIGKVVSCIRFLLIPTGVKSNKIKGNEEENQINQGRNFTIGGTSKLPIESSFYYKTRKMLQSALTHREINYS